MLFSIFDVLRLFEALQMFFYKFLLKWGKDEENFESNIFFEAQKYYFVLESRLNFFFKWSYLQRCFDVAQRFENRRWKWQRYFNVVLCCKFQSWHTQRCLNVDLTLCDIATSYQPKDNVELTLKCLLEYFTEVIIVNKEACSLLIELIATTCTLKFFF